MTERPTARELAWLDELNSGQLLGRHAEKQVPDETKEKLISLGLLEEKLGGLAVTMTGLDVLSKS
jgi:hypothetical protein